jgi:CheY-like chemotaxis protein/two-component sensor histidine kinase
MLWAADYAARLTRQLLAFARRQVLNLEALDLNAVVSDLERMLHRLIGEDIALAAHLSDAPIFVRADRGQLEQVIVNLAINARDAMPDGGLLEITVSPCESGAGAALEVRDTGIGMDEATAARVFEPFFTTKEMEGTGLGLATVHGIVNQSGGSVSVVSSPGQGSTFTITLPAAAAPSATRGRQSDFEAPVGGGETILLVEDDDAVRGAIRAMLEARGYSIHAMSSGDEAVEFASRYEGDFDLLLTDLVMPGRNGRETANLIRALRPSIGVLYMSGYADSAVLPDVAMLIRKPFGSDELAYHVRAALGDRRS